MAAKGEHTRATILRTAASLATVKGLEGLSIGDLAAALGMSKSGLYAHFGSKEDLQLATVDEAWRIFREEVTDPVADVPAGRARLLALFDAFYEHLARGTFPGGCFFVGASLEVGNRPGPVRERVAEFVRWFGDVLGDQVRIAEAGGELPDGTDVELLHLNLSGLIVAPNNSFVLNGDPAVLDVGRRAVRRLLGAPSEPAALRRSAGGRARHDR